MTGRNYRLRQPTKTSSDGLLVLGVVAFVIAVSLIVWVGFWVAAQIDGVTKVGAGPGEHLKGLWSRTIPQSGLGWAISAVICTALVALLLTLYRKIRLGRLVGSRRVDDKARYLGVADDISSLQAAAVAAKATRLNVAAGVGLGIPIGRLVSSGGGMIYGSWEDMHLDIWGPRTGKTTSRAIPAIMAAPGPVLVTSNKRDVVDATRLPRSQVGQVWVFDPQNICGENPDWFWNPLTYCVDETKAATLAACFASGTRSAAAKTDAFFDSQGEGLLAGLLLAAAEAGLPIGRVYEWVTHPGNDEPVKYLRAKYPFLAAKVEGVCYAPDKQRQGVYSTAEGMVSCLLSNDVRAWVTPDSAKPEFVPDDFIAATTGTLYSLSKEGEGTAGPLVTALTVAVVEAAERAATVQPGGRLSRPLVGVLDEAANVCRWRALPDKYSHYGSRGIILMTILQSWSQGVEVWGEAGMNKLWSASNIAVYGGGVKEARFLDDLVKLAGDFDKYTTSTSRGRGQSSSNTQISRETIFTVSDLAAMPAGRALVFASGSRPTLVQTQPWYTSEYAPLIEASLQEYDPGRS